MEVGHIPDFYTYRTSIKSNGIMFFNGKKKLAKVGYFFFMLNAILNTFYMEENKR